MSTLEDFYASVGADATSVISRLGGNSVFVLRFLSMFKSDSSFKELCSALDKEDTQTAFRAAHTLKGVCATLGLQRLFEQASAVTELLRGGSLAEAKLAMPALEQEYKQVLEALKSLNA